MTVIIAIERNGVVYMGADSCVSCGKRKETLKTEDFVKIQVMSNGLLLGVAGPSAGKQLLLSHKEELFSFADNKLSKDGIIKEFLPAIIELYDKEKMLDEDGYLPNSILLAKDGDLFVVHSTKETYRVTSYAIGSGTIGGLSILEEGQGSVENRILDGMRLASKMETGVCAPYILVNTKERKIQEVKE